MNALVELGGLGGCPAKEQARRVASFEKKWNFQLRRLYPGMDFIWLAPALLDAATQALLSCQSSNLGSAFRRRPGDSGALRA